MTREDHNKRSAGILLHPTSLPGTHGIGELGPEALRFVEFLEAARQRLWQILPLGPTDAGGSPYSSYSAFAGNPLLVSTGSGPARSTDSGRVDYPAVVASKTKRLREMYGRSNPGACLREFREEHSEWLGDYALFAALKSKFGGEPWSRWDEGLARREPAALKSAERALREEIHYHEFVQHKFFQQWGEVKRAANDAGIEIVGDLPIFVSHDSADVWANQELFHLGESGEPAVVAGVPPDYFSETGQRWGNPLYDWERMRQSGYAWWVERMRMALTLCDAVRIDHFRGFESYWEIAADEETAKNGRWVKGPGAELFTTLRKKIGTGGELPLIAEDLGEITPEVEALRRRVGLPGMKVLQFAFSDPDNHFLPHNYDGPGYVVYTGTHDNDTTAGWWSSATLEERDLARRYLGREYLSVWDFIRLAYSSTARRAIVPMQDILELGSEARMNTPGTADGNWSWRMDAAALTSRLAEWLKHLAGTYNR